MDYKEVVDTLRWHARFSDLNGAQLRLITFMASMAAYKTSEITVSYGELMKEVGLSKVTVAKAVAELVKKRALTIINSGVGRMQTTYLVTSAQELTDLFVEEERNPEFNKWDYEFNERFYELQSEFDLITLDCEECVDEEDGSLKMCPMHTYQTGKFKQRSDWKEYQFWLKRNPKPNMLMRTINGKVLEG